MRTILVLAISSQTRVLIGGGIMFNAEYAAPIRAASVNGSGPKAV